MKRNTLLPVFCLLLIGLAIQACKKSKRYYAIDAGMKAAFNYMPGTYWVYKDSISGKEDSFVVWQNSSGTNQTYEWVSDVIGVYIHEFDINGNVSGWELFLESNTLSLKWDVNPSVYISFGPLITYPFKLGYVNNSEFAVVTKIDSVYYVNGHVFTNVAEINDTTNASSSPYNDWFYLSADAGIIKMKLNHPPDINKILELERYHIVK